ncbi:MAG: VOC family protein [Chloroflexi bacterium]|nr:VOC family protein [Chloroflexota bacterium]
MAKASNQVIWIEFPVKNMARAKKFYYRVFGQKFTDMDMPGMKMAMFPWHEGAPFASGALVKAENYVPNATGAVVYFSCEDVADELSRAESNGGKVIVPKTSIGESGYFAHILDTEGNRVGLHSMH